MKTFLLFVVISYGTKTLHSIWVLGTKLIVSLPRSSFKHAVFVIVCVITREPFVTLYAFPAVFSPFFI